MPSMHMPPPNYGDDSNSEGGSRLLPSLRLAVEGMGGERKGEGNGEQRGGGAAGERLAALRHWEREWQISCNCLKLRGC